MRALYYIGLGSYLTLGVIWALGEPDRLRDEGYHQAIERHQVMLQNWSQDQSMWETFSEAMRTQGRLDVISHQRLTPREFRTYLDDHIKGGYRLKRSLEPQLLDIPDLP